METKPDEISYEASLLNTEPRDVLGVEPRQIRLFRDERDQIRLTLLDDRSYLRVKAMIAFPLTSPGRTIGLSDAKGGQICLIESLDDLDAESRAIVEEMIAIRYFVPRILRVKQARDEFGVVRWNVETDRGSRVFYVRNLRDSLTDLPDREQLMTDVDGNRFILPHVDTFDRDSRAAVLRVL